MATRVGFFTLVAEVAPLALLVMLGTRHTLQAQEQRPLSQSAQAPIPVQPAPRVTPAPPSTLPQSADPFSPSFQPNPMPSREEVQIDPNTPLKDLLPEPPVIQTPTGPLTREELRAVPEVTFQAPAKSLGKKASREKPIVEQIAKINHLNRDKTDGFLVALLGQRPDLAGLPFAMGDACRTTGDRNRELSRAVTTIRAAMPTQGVVLGMGVNPAAGISGTVVMNTFAVASQPTAPSQQIVQGTVDQQPESTFWQQFQSACAQQDRTVSPTDTALTRVPLPSRPGTARTRWLSASWFGSITIATA